jgi:hypothetical protein
MCFVWAILSALHPVEKHTESISKYRPHLNSINLTGLSYPVPVNRVAGFEKTNPVGRVGLVVSAPDLKLGDPGSSLGVAHETNA